MAIKHIVFDTTCWISYFYNAQLHKLVEIKIDKDIIIYTTPKQLQEIQDVLRRPKLKGKLKLPIEEYLNFCKLIAIEVEVNERFDRLADLKDNYLIDLAYTIKADHIVSSDRDLLSLKHLGKIQIISLTAFKKALELS